MPSIERLEEVASHALAARAQHSLPDPARTTGCGAGAGRDPAGRRRGQGRVVRPLGRVRQATRRRGHVPNEQAALKVLYLVIRSPIANRTNVTGRTTGWKAALNALAMFYGDRITPN